MSNLTVQRFAELYDAMMQQRQAASDAIVAAQRTANRMADAEFSAGGRRHFGYGCLLMLVLLLFWKFAGRIHKKQDETIGWLLSVVGFYSFVSFMIWIDMQF